uniref:Ion transport domain-containing protein n=1 Tax=Mustela putorius furo TaxID=9669 RepID=M3YBW1_MUSPF
MRRTFEEPTSSLAAQILASVSVVFVIVSMVVLCASTLPDWRAAAADNRSLDDRSRIIEAICIGWFTAECIVRFIVSKNKCRLCLCLILFIPGSRMKKLLIQDVAVIVSDEKEKILAARRLLGLLLCVW